jgi:hypothetical protein
MFDIRFELGPEVDLGNRMGSITLGSHTERFQSPVGYWSLRDYEQQWIAAARRLLSEPETVFLTSVADPDAVEVIRGWPMWRDDELVYVHERLFILNQLDHKFDVEQPYSHIGQRLQIGEDGRISEWRLQVEDISSFLQRRAGQYVPA